MALCVALMALLAAVGALGYLPHDAGPKYLQEPFLSDSLLREVVERMGKDLVGDVGDSYMEYVSPESHLALMARASKDLETEQFDYDSLIDGNPNPSLRDQEYLQHSTLWKEFNAKGDDGSQGGGGLRLGNNGESNKPMKAEAGLPAYCNPPNPCPVGYTEKQGCMTQFENTAAFSREYQSEQSCMCDREHMFDCDRGGGGGASSSSSSSGSSSSSVGDHAATILDRLIAQHLQDHEHKNLVAKKFHVKKSQNPYLSGEKLPIAAKKGINVDMAMD